MKTRRVLERAGVMLRGFCLYLLLVASLLLFLSGTAYPAESLSLNIEDCIELALQNNLSYQIAQSKVEIKEEQVQEAEGAKKINAKFQGGYVRTSDAPDPDKIVAGDYSYLYSSGTGVPLISFNISKILYSGGKLKNLIELAKAEQSIALNELEGDRQELIYKVTEAYYRVLQAEGLKRVSAQALTQIKAHLESSRSLLTEGMIAPIDLNRINSQLSNLEHNLIRAENGYLLTVYNLNSIMGIDLETSLKLENDLAYEPCDISLEEALESARQYRPELEQVSQQKKIMKNMLNIAKSNKGPQIMMNMDSGLAGWKVAIAGEIPIFDGGVNKSKIKQAELSLAQVEQSEKQALQLIEFEVRSLYLKMVEAEKLVKVTEQGIGDSEESFRIAQVKYNEGISTNIEVIDAQSALIEAETNHLNALYDYNTNRAALIKAMGLL
ncbi:MAG: TolC family protein [Candidatus Atribacteria bacterium]|nr:TolC family protein [Candidatus Atribacteria bacterium]